MLPKAARRQQQQGQGQQQRQDAEEEGRPLQRRPLAKHELPYEPLADASRLPRTVTWRGTGADSIGVKDQANCGSCWWVLPLPAPQACACSGSCKQSRNVASHPRASRAVHLALACPSFACRPLLASFHNPPPDPGMPSPARCVSQPSCRSFGAAGAMEAAWFAATGRQVSFSEQQILDCSWGYVPGEEAATMGEGELGGSSLTAGSVGRFWVVTVIHGAGASQL